jgi:hypothetical protein
MIDTMIDTMIDSNSIQGKPCPSSSPLSSMSSSWLNAILSSPA